MSQADGMSRAACHGPALGHRLEHRVEVHQALLDQAVLEQQAGLVAQSHSAFQRVRPYRAATEQDAREPQIRGERFDGLGAGVPGESEHDDAFRLVHCFTTVAGPTADCLFDLADICMLSGSVDIALTYGDPAGIGPEIAARLLARLPDGARAIVYGDPGIMAAGAAVAGVSVPHDACAFREVPWQGALPAPGQPDTRCGTHVVAVLEALGADLRARTVRAVVTGPVHKGVVRRIRPDFVGHTEFFAQVGGVSRFGMLLVVEPLRALHVTTHIALRDVPAALTPERIADTIALAAEALDLLGEPDRPIGVCGLNPHAGEGGAFGDEEARLIAPAIATARARGYAAVGPLPPDAAFPQAAKGAYGVIVCMYHDQGHIALKLLGMNRGINVTVGLPFIRTSVDHGTAFDIAGRGVADPGSLRAAWALACTLYNSYSGDPTLGP